MDALTQTLLARQDAGAISDLKRQAGGFGGGGTASNTELTSNAMPSRREMFARMQMPNRTMPEMQNQTPFWGTLNKGMSAMGDAVKQRVDLSGIGAPAQQAGLALPQTSANNQMVAPDRSKVFDMLRNIFARRTRPMARRGSVGGL